MQEVTKPWLAYKVLAAGAIHPREGFKFAFENGADFIVAGMFDFQVEQDANIAEEILARLAKSQRKRPWRG
jgi:NAD(P)H-dependent flavin oxidoreductase YrpB (nitropropane dioxygenase family)